LISSEQVRAARAMLRLSVVTLSEQSGVGVATIKRLEASDGLPSAHIRTVVALRQALESLGIEFLGGPSDHPGVRLLQRRHREEA
jgi:transcriptional regulator with XRE-family HTH domain